MPCPGSMLARPLTHLTDASSSILRADLAVVGMEDSPVAWGYRYLQHVERHRKRVGRGKLALLS